MKEAMVVACELTTSSNLSNSKGAKTKTAAVNLFVGIDRIRLTISL